MNNIYLKSKDSYDYKNRLVDFANYPLDNANIFIECYDYNVNISVSWGSDEIMIKNYSMGVAISLKITERGLIKLSSCKDIHLNPLLIKKEKLSKKDIVFNKKTMQNFYKLTKDDSNVDYLVSFMLDILAYIQYAFTCEKVEVFTSKSIRSNNNKNKKSNNNKNKIFITNKKYIIKKVDYDESCLKRTNKRHIDSWSVRGHYRTYKSGKKVWISPQVRGNKDGEIKTEYNIKI